MGFKEWFEQYKRHCDEMDPSEKPGNAFWIAPNDQFTVYNKNRPYSYKRNTPIGQNQFVNLMKLWYDVLGIDFGTFKPPSMNSLRVTYTNFLFEAGIPISKIMLRTGHSSAAIEKYIAEFRSARQFRDDQYLIMAHAS